MNRILFTLLSFVMGTIYPFTVRFCDPHNVNSWYEQTNLSPFSLKILINPQGNFQQINLQVNQVANIEASSANPASQIFFGDPVGAFGALTLPQSPGPVMTSTIPGSCYMWFEQNSTGYWVLKRTYIADYHSGSNDCNSPVFAGVFKQAQANNTQIIAPFYQGGQPAVTPHWQSPPSAGGLD